MHEAEEVSAADPREAAVVAAHKEGTSKLVFFASFVARRDMPSSGVSRGSMLLF
jgi:hypothetical protein